MKVKKVIVESDNNITDCFNCPLRPSFTWEQCGREVKFNENGAVLKGKRVPDKRCKIRKVSQ